MKKIIKILAIVFAITNCSSVCFANEIEPKPLRIDDPLRLNNMVKTLLMPEVANAVNTFYSQYLSENPTVVPYLGYEITEIKGGELIHDKILNSEYTVTVEVIPFVGAHVSVGKDRITLHFHYDGVISVEKFEHLESYELTPNLKDIIVKPLP